MTLRPAFSAHLGKYPALVSKLALIFHVIGLTTGKVKDASSVSLDSLERAIKWVDFLRLHAEKTYFDEVQPEVRPARLLALKIRSRQILDGIHVRNIRRHQWRGLSRQDDIENGLLLLEQCGWVKIDVKTGNGQPSRVVRINPKLVNSNLDTDITDDVEEEV
jgi:hypothetical protein